MNEIKIFIYINKLPALSNAKWKDRINVLKRFSIAYETEINKFGGIYNKNVKIIYKSFAEIGDQFTQKLINHLKRNRDYSLA